MRAKAAGQAESGMALLIVLSVISILIAVSLELNARTREAVIRAASQRNRVTGLALASSGVHAAMALLAKDKEKADTDTLQEQWADAHAIEELIAEMALDQGKVTVAVTDERGKLQVNAMVRFPDRNVANDRQMFLWERFLEQLKQGRKELEEIEPRTIVNAIKDWIDAGDDDAISGTSGAESAYYQKLDPPYACPNRPMVEGGELQRIRGVTPALMADTELGPGLAGFVTVWGVAEATAKDGLYDGRININTAPLSVLAAVLPPELSGLAADIVAFRDEKSDKGFVNDVSSANWYASVPGFQVLEGEALSAFRNLITTASDCFSITAEAVVNDVRTRVGAVVYRQKEAKTGKWRCRVASWQVH